MDYNSTLNLPKTDFPMRAELPKREPGMLETFQNNKIYEKLIEQNKGKPSYILHDGPPFANGDIHMGHALNKLLKDFLVRYKNMAGFYSPYVPGWDNHGLPIESQVVKVEKISRAQVGDQAFRDKCQEFSQKYVNNQREQFKRLGVMGEWDNPYLTMDPVFEARQIEIFGEMAKKGYIYKGLKPVYWCCHDETALAEAEIEYQDQGCDSVYVKFKVNDDQGKLAQFGDLENIHFVIWTTTIWTLPGNLAISLNGNFEYVLMQVDGKETYIVAKELSENLFKLSGGTDMKILATFKGEHFENMTARHPFYDRESRIILGEHVTLEAGTGCVHTAPGHGVDDFLVCKKYGIDVVVPVDAKGHMTKEAGQFEGLFYKKANQAIFDELKESGALLASESISHSYPHCWRCKNPIIFRATDQWFASVDALKKQAIEQVKKVNWLPAWGEERMVSMISERSDWCVSRQRIWGVPIPIFYCKTCKKPVINERTIKAVADLFKVRGSAAWFELEAEQILPQGFTCPECDATGFTKETDTMDGWFDSGSSHSAVLDARDYLTRPADLYLEGADQYRGWFQSSLLTSIATTGDAPYKEVLTHGWTVDGNGKKMSKSIGNTIVPAEVIQQYGADVLRLWVASVDYRVDVRMSKEILKQLSEAYLKIRNTARFILGNLTGFDADNLTPVDKMEELDRWAVLKLGQLVAKVDKAYKDYEFHLVYHSIYSFCVLDMSNFYLDIIKDRLYCETKDGEKRRSAQSAMFMILDALVRMIAPILSFTSDEIWSFMPHKKTDKIESAMLNPFPTAQQAEDKPLMEKWEAIRQIRTEVNKAIEEKRAAGQIGKSLEACVKVVCDGDRFALLSKIADQLATLFIVSQVKVEQGADSIEITQADGEKCVRCWIYSTQVGANKDHPQLCPRCAGVM